MKKLITLFVILLPSVTFGGGAPWNDYSNQSQMQEIIMYYSQARTKISEYESRLRYQEERIKELQAENLKLQKQLSVPAQQSKEKTQIKQN